MTIYSLRGVGKSLSGRTVLESVDLDVLEGEVTALVGPSGSGKSTLLRLLNRLMEPEAGTIEYRGRPIGDYQVLSLRREAVMVPQDGTVFPGSVADNVAYASRIHGWAPIGVEDAIMAAGLDRSFLMRDAERLSGGERKRVALARALALEPRVLLLDEPTAGVDPRSSAVIEESVLRLKEGGTTVVWVTHDVEQAKRVSDRVANLKAGKVVTSTEGDFRWGDAY